MAYKVGRGNTFNTKAIFRVYENGPLFDPIDDSVHPQVSFYFNDVVMFGPFQYLNGHGPVNRASLGHYNYTLAIPENASLGTWVAKWNGGPTFIEETTFEVIDLSNY